MDPNEIVALITANPAFSMIATAVTLALGDFVTGTARAIRLGQFKVARVSEWVSQHLLGRVMPLAFLATLSPGNEPLMAIVAAGLATYTAETLASIKANLDWSTDPDPDLRQGVEDAGSNAGGG
jgi:hypothetical protein